MAVATSTVVYPKEFLSVFVAPRLCLKIPYAQEFHINVGSQKYDNPITMSMEQNASCESNCRSDSQ